MEGRYLEGLEIDVNNQQGATTFSFINLLNSALHFGRQIRPSSGALFDCIYSFWYNAPTLQPTDRKQCRCIVPTAVYTVKKCS